MQKKSDAHKGLSLLASQYGVLAAIAMDNAREQTMGNFRKKAKKWDVTSNKKSHTHPGKMLLMGAGRKMTSSKAPQKLWDHCLD